MKCKPFPRGSHMPQEFISYTDQTRGFANKKNIQTTLPVDNDAWRAADQNFRKRKLKC